MNRSQVPDRKTQPSISPQIVIHDGLFLTLVALLSLILYVSQLGFYSDDWNVLELLKHSDDQSFLGLLRALFYDPTRPIQMIYLTFLYWLFGPHALAFHLANAVSFTTLLLLFYLTLRELGVPRLLTVALPLVYGLLPHYSTARFWVPIQPYLSIAFYFLSLYSSVRALRARRARSWAWGLLSIFSLLSSVFTYDVAVPLFILNFVVVWHISHYRGAPDGPAGRTRTRLLLTGQLLTFSAAVAFKALSSDRLEGTRGYISNIWRASRGAVSIFYGKYGYGVGFPRTMVSLLRQYPDKLIVAVGVAVGLLISGYLYHITRHGNDTFSRRRWLAFIGLGLVVFGLGYAIFATNAEVGFSKTGMVNRTAIAASLGMAMQLVGGLGLVSTILRSHRLRRLVFCALVALVCTCGFIINNTIATFWIEANRQRDEVLSDIHHQFPTLPAGSTLILDGVCPYVGPAVVFEAYFDMGPALMMLYNDRSLRGDVVTPRLGIGESGLTSYIYGTSTHGFDDNDRKTFIAHCCPSYPYSEKLLLYNFRQKKAYQLINAAAARSYFQAFNQTQNGDCKGTEGVGAWVF